MEGFPNQKLSPNGYYIPTTPRHKIMPFTRRAVDTYKVPSIYTGKFLALPYRAT